MAASCACATRSCSSFAEYCDTAASVPASRSSKASCVSGFLRHKHQCEMFSVASILTVSNRSKPCLRGTRGWTKACQVPEGLGGMLPIHIHEKGPKLPEDSQRCAVPVDGAPGGAKEELSIAANMCRSTELQRRRGVIQAEEWLRTTMTRQR